METTSHDITAVAESLQLDRQKVANTIALLDEGGTIPFIARYRKERTGSLDEVQIGAIRDTLSLRLELGKRKEAIVASLAERDLLDAALRAKIDGADSMTRLEDIYLPYRPKRKTRATAAREKRLEPLARTILAGGNSEAEAEKFVNSERAVASAEEALAGARDIVAEMVSESEEVRSRLRTLFTRRAQVNSRVVKKRRDEAATFRDYFDWCEPAAAIAGHRLLAILRGESQNFLKVSIKPDPEEALTLLAKLYGTRAGGKDQLTMAVEDSYSRLLAPALENELRNTLKEKADSQAIAVFAGNLEELLLAPPLGAKRVMALDPGYRTGAKLVCLDAQGTLLHRETVYPTLGGNRAREAGEVIVELTKKYTIEAIAIGDGTAGRETEAFVRSLGLDDSIIITLVNEDGASIYSASETARREFPDEDLTVRGAVSIGRRLQDPLAELVKIDPKSIGVGQYQHDVDQNALKKELGEVVGRCVNRVGVEVNSASIELLSYVAGLGPGLAANIVDHRRLHGPFRSRRELLKVKRLGAKAFEQCAGFLRVGASANPLDNSGVHPESYSLVERMAADRKVAVAEMLRSETVRRAVRLENYCSGDVGMETLTDIMAELAAPGRDPRQQFEAFRFDDSVHSIDDLHEGMILPALITNVTKFGAFADIGIKSDGLIHISRMAKRFVRDPNEVVRVRQQVRVRVVEIDRERGRIGLSLILE